MNDKLKRVLCLPPCAQRKGEGGLRKNGHCKISSLGDRPLITVVTVVFNGSNTIEKTILSVINQSYDNVEYIIIDGGSTDCTLDVIKKYEHAIDYWVSEPDCGIYDAMNKGWSLACNEGHIIYLGSGDTIKTFPLLLHADSSAIIYGDVSLGANRIFNSKHGWRLILGNSLHHQALFIPKKLHQNPPFDTRHKIYADFDFNQRLMKMGCSFRKQNILIADALPGGISSQFNITEITSIVKTNFGIFCFIISYFYMKYQKTKLFLTNLKY